MEINQNTPRNYEVVDAIMASYGDDTELITTSVNTFTRLPRTTGRFNIEILEGRNYEGRK